MVESLRLPIIRKFKRMQRLSSIIEELKIYSSANEPKEVIKYCDQKFTKKLAPYRLISYARKLCEKNEILAENCRSSLTQRKKVTVVTVNYNNREGLKKTINTVLSQKARDDIQFIVIDGNSDDGSLDYLKEVEGLIDIVAYGDDKGVYDAMNRGVELSNSDYCIFMNSGDCFDSNEVVCEVIKHAESNSYPDFIYGSARYEDNSIWRPLDVRNIWRGMICCHQSAFFKTSLLKKLGSYSLSNTVVSDFELIAKFYSTGAQFSKLDLVISQIEPVGISADFTTRTLERWKVIRKLQFGSVDIDEIDTFYRDLLSTNGDWAAPHFHTINKAQSSLISNIEKRVCFLISMPRSGSTLLQRIIDQSDEISTAGEPWFMLPLASMYDESLIEASYGQNLNIMAKNEFVNDTGLNNIIDNAQKVYADSIYSTVLSQLKTRYFLDKTPRYVHVVEKLSQIYPNAKFIVLKRNPAAVISSYATTWYSNDYAKVNTDKLAVNDFKYGFQKLAEFSQKNCKNKLVIDYETLVSEPESQAAKIFSFLGIKFNENFVNYNQNSAIKKFTFGDPSSVYSKNRPDPSHNNKWLKSIESFKHAKQFLTTLDLVPEAAISKLGYSKLDIENKLDEKFNLRLPKSESLINEISGDFRFELVANSDLDLGTLGVLITCFNDQYTIIQCLESVIKQSKKPDLIVIADDCSTDRSVELIKDYISKFSDIEIRLIERDVNVGVTRNRDEAIKSMDVDLITTLDGDDMIFPGKLAAEYEQFDSPEVVVSFSDILMLNKDAQVHIETKAYNRMYKQDMLENVCSRKFPVPRDMMFRKSLFIKAMGFDMNMEIYEDWALKMRLIAFMEEGEYWSHSGTIGTIYDRRNLGLSGRSPVVLAYGQLLALARNCDYLNNAALAAGLETVSSLLDGKCKTRLLDVVNSLNQGKESELYRSRLKRIWYERDWSLRSQQINELIWSFSGPTNGAPTFCICTPCFNSSATIEKTIESVLGQEGDFHLRYHVQDGGSTDGTVEILQRVKEKLSKGSIGYNCKSLTFTFDTEKDDGMYDALVKAFDKFGLGGNEWLSWINADDHFLPGAFAHVSKCSASYDIQWITGISSVMEADGSLKQSFRPVNSAIISRGLADGKHWNFLQQEGTFFKAKLWGAIDKTAFNSFRYAGDWNLWVQFASISQIHIARRVMANFCKVQGQLSEVGMSKYIEEINRCISEQQRLASLESFPVSEGEMLVFEDKEGKIEMVQGSVLGHFVAKLKSMQ